MKRRILATLLSITMCFTILGGSSWAVFADNSTSSSGTIINRTVNICGNSLCDLSFNYQALTTGSNTKYSDNISKLAILLSTDIPFSEETAANESLSIFGDQKCAMEQFGFTDVTAVDLRDRAESYSVDSNDFAGFFMGRRAVKIGKKDYVVYAIAVRGTLFLREWISNIDVGSSSKTYGKHPQWTDKKMHKGFEVTANRIMKELDKYIKEHRHDDKGKEKSILITGHSRGAAIANIIGKKYEDMYKENESIKPYTYTFATPAVSVESKSKLRSYKTIFNLINTDDVVPCLPLQVWGYGRYGRDLEFSIEDTPVIKEAWAQPQFISLMQDLDNCTFSQLGAYSIIPIPELPLLNKIFISYEDYTSAQGIDFSNLLTEFFNDEDNNIVKSREFLYQYSIPAWIPNSIDDSYAPYYITAQYPADRETVYEKYAAKYDCKYVSLAPFYFVHALDSNIASELAGNNDVSLQAIIDMLEVVNEMSEEGRIRPSTIRKLSDLAADSVSDDIRNLLFPLLNKMQYEQNSNSKYLKLAIDILKLKSLDGFMNSHLPLSYCLAINMLSDHSAMNKTSNGFSFEYVE